MVISTGDTLSTRLRELRRAQRRHDAHSAGSTRELVVVAFGVGAATMLLIVVLALASLLAAGSSLTGLTAAAGAMWLSAHQVPLTISEVTIGILPLLPTLLIVAIVARVTAGAASRRGRSEIAAVLLAAVAGPLLITVLSLALVMDGSTVLTVASPNVLLALACTVAVHGVGAGLGVSHGQWARIGARLGVAEWAPNAMRAAAVAVIGLLSAGALLLVVRLVWQFSVVGDVLTQGNGFAGALGLTVLSVLYLPNMVIGASAVLVGADAHIGTAGGDLFSAHGGSVPPLPVVAVLPSTVSVAAPGLMLLTAIVAFVAARRAVHVDPMRATRTVAATAGLAAVAMVVLTWIGGGQLGELGSAGATVPATGVFTFGWFAVVGMVVTLVHGLLPSTRAARRAWYAGDEAFDDLDPEDAEFDDDLEAHDPEGVDAPAVDDADDSSEGRDGFPGDDEPTVEVEPVRAPASMVFGVQYTDPDDRH
ncbi:cell division protein PerM [Williamsia sp. MIQD14]|uniref:cell division protein PerM n=1 Tax=Williamsia sp. MIQD14 TaxID=3425703 RepID=UPI003D9FD8CB